MNGPFTARRARLRVTLGSALVLAIGAAASSHPRTSDASSFGPQAVGHAAHEAPDDPLSPDRDAPAPPRDAPLEPPSDADLRAHWRDLARELELLELAATREVRVPPHIATLRELLEALSAQAGITVEGDWEGLLRLGVDPDEAPPISQGDGSLLAVLDALCTSLGSPTERPRPEALLGRLRIVSPVVAGSLRRLRVYHAGPLASEFMPLAEDHIDPEGWQRNGGEVQHATTVDGAVIVSAPASTHRRLSQLLDELRATRPAAVGISIDLLRVPGEPFRALAMEASDSGEVVTGAALESLRGASRLAAPTLVAVMDLEAAATIVQGGWTIDLRLRPRRLEALGTIIEYEVAARREEVSVRLSGSVPLPTAGDPAVLAFEEGTEDAVIVLRIRARPLPRPPASGAAQGP